MKKREEPLGSLEHVVLLAVMRLGEGAYGVTVRREIEGATGRALSIGAVYATLVRLESKGFVIRMRVSLRQSAAGERSATSA